jgi:hypothetical protein
MPPIRFSTNRNQESWLKNQETRINSHRHHEGFCDKSHTTRTRTLVFLGGQTQTTFISQKFILTSLKRWWVDIGLLNSRKQVKQVAVPLHDCHVTVFGHKKVQKKHICVVVSITSVGLCYSQMVDRWFNKWKHFAAIYNWITCRSLDLRIRT